MKQYKLHITLLSILLLAACSHEEEPSPTPQGEDAFVTVSVAVDGIARTKVLKTEPLTQPGNDDENAIKNLTVVFIDEKNNEVIAHGYRETGAEKDTKTDTETETARVGLKTGTYKMLLIANTNEVSSFNPADYYDLTTSLDMQGVEKGFVMSHVAEEVDIVAGENNITGKTVKRVVGRVDLSKVAVDWHNDLKNMEGLQFKLKEVFLANVRPNSYLFDTSGKEAGHTIEKKEGGYLCGIDKFYTDANSEIVDGNVAASYLNKFFDPATEIEQGEKNAISNVAQFYAMTNSDTKDSGTAPVILYIKGDLYDSVNKKNVLTDRYYRIKLAKGVQRNTLYQIEATIQGKGSPEPGDNKENIDMSVTITTKTWDGVTLDRITIDEEIEI